MSEKKFYERRTIQLIRREVIERVRAYHPEDAKIEFEQRRLSRIVKDTQEGEDVVFPIVELKA